VIGNDITVSFAPSRPVQLTPSSRSSPKPFKSVNHLRAGTWPRMRGRHHRHADASASRGSKKLDRIVTRSPLYRLRQRTEIAQEALVTGQSVTTLVLAKKLLTARAARPDPAAGSADGSQVVRGVVGNDRSALVGPTEVG